MIDKTCFILICDFPNYIQRTLSSKYFKYAYKNIFSSIELGLKGYQYNKHALIKLPVAITDVDISVTDCDIYKRYGISQDEIDYIAGL